MNIPPQVSFLIWRKTVGVITSENAFLTAVHSCWFQPLNWTGCLLSCLSLTQTKTLLIRVSSSHIVHLGVENASVGVAWRKKPTRVRHRGKVLQTAQWNHRGDNLFQTCCRDCASGFFRITIIKLNTACFFLPGVHMQLHELCDLPPLGHMLLVSANPHPVPTLSPT